jgi:hypothetical protein
MNESIEALAMALHESGREAVIKRLTVHNSLSVQDMQNALAPKFVKGFLERMPHDIEKPPIFIEWDELRPEAKQGHMIQASWLLERYKIEQFREW